MRSQLSRILLGLVAGAVAIGAAGCWFEALQLAPVGLRVAEDIGVGVLSLTARGATAPGLGVIELHKGAAQAPEYRELGVAGLPDDPRWVPVVDGSTDSDGWRPAVNLTRMNFMPPLDDAVPAAGTSYLAYALAQPDSPAEQDRLAAFDKSFGKPVGTFMWKGRVYQYSLPRALPGFTQSG